MGKEERLRKLRAQMNLLAKPAEKIVGPKTNVSALAKLKSGLGSDIHRRVRPKKWKYSEHMKKPHSDVTMAHEKHSKAPWERGYFRDEKDFKRQMQRGPDSSAYRLGKLFTKKVKDKIKEHFPAAHGLKTEVKTKRRAHDLESRVKKLEGGIGKGALGGQPVDAPVSRSYNAPRTFFKFSHEHNAKQGGSDSITIHGTDYLTTINGTKLDDAVGTTIYKIVINPKEIGVNRLKNFSKLFERYHMKIKIKYNQATTTEKIGSMIGYFELDVDDDPPPATQEGVIEAFGHTGNRSTSYWRNCEWTMPSRASTDELWVDAGTEERLVNQAIFYLLVEVPAGDTSDPGTLSVDWECRLWQSKTDSVDEEVSGFLRQNPEDYGTCTNLLPFGDSVFALSGSNPGIVSNCTYSDSGGNSRWTFGEYENATQYLIYHNISGTGLGNTATAASNFVYGDIGVSTSTASLNSHVRYGTITDTSLPWHYEFSLTTATTIDAAEIVFIPIRAYVPAGVKHLTNAIKNGEELAQQMAKLLEILERDKAELKKKQEDQKTDPVTKETVPTDDQKYFLTDRQQFHREKMLSREKVVQARQEWYAERKPAAPRSPDFDYDMVDQKERKPETPQVTPKQGKKLSVKA
jgi:hypothetical protein